MNSGNRCTPSLELDWVPNRPSKSTYWRLLFKRASEFSPSRPIPAFVAMATERANPESLRIYRELTQTPNHGHLPLLYPHVMMGSAHLEMMAHPQFPLPPIGMLHLRNHVVQKAPIPEQARLELECRLARQRVVEKGIELEIDSRVMISGEEVWSSISTLFKRGKFGAPEAESELAQLFPKLAMGEPAGTERAGAEENDSGELETMPEIVVPPDIGKRYAAVSGDRNLIHTSNLMAKLFGFQRAIAHGMWTSARILPALMNEVPPQCRFDVVFKGPVFVGSRVKTKGSTQRFDLFCDSNPRPVICGRFLPDRGWDGWTS